MSTELDEAVARLKACVRPEHTWPFPDADVRLLLADWERRGERIAEFERLQTVWLMSPEAAKRLEGYRELAAKCAALEAERDAARAGVERLTKEESEPLSETLRSALAEIRANNDSRPAQILLAHWEGRGGQVVALRHRNNTLRAELARLRERDAKVRAVLGNPEIDRQTAITEALRLLEETP